MLLTVSSALAGGLSNGASLVGAMIRALILTGLLALAVLLAVVTWPMISQILVAAPLIALFAYCTYPRPRQIGGAK